ncbi:MAG: phytanoyl-CoA dioxygenase family protein [Rhizomicrobium sp.]
MRATNSAYAMLNRSPLAQQAIASRALLDAIEPLLGEDCHVIANTAWRNAPGHQGGALALRCRPARPAARERGLARRHPLSGFAIGVHIFLQDCPMEAGPTAVLPGSHRSGRLPPKERLDDPGLTFENKPPVYLPARAGDAILFVSDLWHRGTPAQDGHGRFFLQCHYGRRDLAQRIVPTAEVNQLSPEAIARAQSERDKTLIGLHPPFFYDG